MFVFAKTHREICVFLLSRPTRGVWIEILTRAMFASLFAGEVGLTLDDLGFATENPASEEAIKAAHENLRLTATKAQRAFGRGFLNAGYLAACLRDGFPYKRNQLYDTKSI